MTDPLDLVAWIDENDTLYNFPDPEKAADDCGGIVAIGGDLSIPRLLAAYRNGIFPWYDEWQPILWWSPSARMVLFPNEMHISRSLRKTLRKNVFQVSADRDFAGVIEKCAATRTDTGTWLNPDMIAAYRELHAAGHAHSVETWADGELVGGVYGVKIGQAFFGESMFSLRSDASKVALVYLAEICRELGIGLIDCQLSSSHLASLGCTNIPRSTFLTLLRRFIAFSPSYRWAREECGTAGLAT